MNYYAKLNENEICTELISTKKDLGGIRGFIEIPDYNETVLYRKWLGDQWSSEKYEPSIESQFQDRIDALEKETKELRETNQNKEDTIAKLREVVSELEMLILSDGGVL